MGACSATVGAWSTPSRSKEGCPRLEKLIGLSAVADSKFIFPFHSICPSHALHVYLIAVSALSQLNEVFLAFLIL
jgi:hypothetical protein